MNTAHAQAFWAQHPPDATWLALYRDSEGRPYREWIVTALHLCEPWHSLFEIGCHCGPQLQVIQRAHPAAVLGGCDVNADAVADAHAHGFSRVVQGAFPACTRSADPTSVDVVLSCYTFAYFDPLDIGAALCEAARIARRAVVLCEPVAWDLSQVGSIDERVFGEWRHAYLHLMARDLAYEGWTVHCQELTVPATRLSGLLVAVRP